MPKINLSRPVAEWELALDPKYRYIFIKGGRSSSKSHGVAGYLTERSFTEKDLRVVCLREVQKSINRSSKDLIESKIRNYKLDSYYKSVLTETRKLSDNGLFLYQGMNDLTADNVKSLEGFNIAWFEEAQNASFKTLKTLRPTIRAEGSQLIFTWNPKLPTDPIDELCASMQGEPDVLVLHINYTDNPFLTETMIREIELEKKNTTDDEFKHIYLGEFDTSFQGHYYAKLLEKARNEGRVTNVPRKSGVDIITAWDLGMRDATAIWVAQRVGYEWRVIDYYENNFEELDHYVDWLRKNEYETATHYIPHDGGHKRIGMKGSIKSQLHDMGIKTINVLPMLSVDSGMSAAKNLLKECVFDATKCKEGLSALNHYHAKYDEVKQIYKEVHDWSSHGSDAFRYLAQATSYKQEKEQPRPQVRHRPMGGGWMSS